MANIHAIHSVGDSLVTYLRNSYPESLRTAHPCEFLLLSGGQLASDDDLGTAVSLYLHRVSINEHLRGRGNLMNPSAKPEPLSLDLYYLLTVWADTALTEQTLFAWAMRQLHRHPTLDTSSLSPEAGWQPGDVVQLIPAELTNEDMMRIWDALTPSYRLSFCYVARVVHIDPEDAWQQRPVIAQRLALGERARGESPGEEAP